MPETWSAKDIMVMELGDNGDVECKGRADDAMETGNAGDVEC